MKALYKAKLSGPNAKSLTDKQHNSILYICVFLGGAEDALSPEKARACIQFIARKFKHSTLILADTLQWSSLLTTQLLRSQVELSSLDGVDTLMPFFDESTKNGKNDKFHTHNIDLTKLAKNYAVVNTWLQKNTACIDALKASLELAGDEWQSRMSSSLQKKNVSVERWKNCVDPTTLAFKQAVKSTLETLIDAAEAAESRSDNFFNAFRATLAKRFYQRQETYCKELAALKKADPHAYSQLLKLIMVLDFNYVLEESAEIYCRGLSLADKNTAMICPNENNRALDYIIRRTLIDGDNPKLCPLSLEYSERKPEVVGDSDTENEEADDLISTTKTSSASNESSKRSHTGSSPPKVMHPGGAAALSSSNEGDSPEEMLPPYVQVKKSINSAIGDLLVKIRISDVLIIDTKNTLRDKLEAILTYVNTEDLELSHSSRSIGDGTSSPSHVGEKQLHTLSFREITPQLDAKAQLKPAEFKMKFDSLLTLLRQHHRAMTTALLDYHHHRQELNDAAKKKARRLDRGVTSFGHFIDRLCDSHYSMGRQTPNTASELTDSSSEDKGVGELEHSPTLFGRSRALQSSTAITLPTQQTPAAPSEGMSTTRNGTPVQTPIGIK